jgi:hypothetical protein
MNPTAVYLARAALLCLAGSFSHIARAQVEPPHHSILNPLGDPPIHLQDPFVFGDSKRYFLFGTASPSEGFQCYESTDLLNWKLGGWAWRMSGLRAAKGQLHAPQVFLYQGMYCMVYSARMASGQQLALAAAVQPQGPYHDLHAPWLDLGGACADGFVFIDNSKPVLVFSKQAAQPEAEPARVYGVALNQDLSKAIGAPVMLLQPDQRWEWVDKKLKRTIESPRIFKIGSKYYLTYTARDPRNSECAIGYATADKPLGPWSKSPDNPLLATKPEAGLLRPAKGSVFRSLDGKEWFFLYQAMGQSVGTSQEAEIDIDRLAVLGIRQLSIQLSARRGMRPVPTSK